MISAVATLTLSATGLYPAPLVRLTALLADVLVTSLGIISSM